MAVCRTVSLRQNVIGELRKPLAPELLFPLTDNRTGWYAKSEAHSHEKRAFPSFYILIIIACQVFKIEDLIDSCYSLRSSIVEYPIEDGFKIFDWRHPACSVISHTPQRITIVVYPLGIAVPFSLSNEPYLYPD